MISIVNEELSLLLKDLKFTLLNNLHLSLDFIKNLGDNS